MRYQALGRTGLEVSQACMGTMTFGGQLSGQESARLVSYALDCGVNLFDTANSYNGGESERILGAALAGRRDEVILATKAGIRLGDGPNRAGLSRRHVVGEMERSLKRLRTDHVDIYYMHTPDHAIPIEEALETYSLLVRSGKVRYIGMSNFSSWEVCEAVCKSELRGYVAPGAAQMVYNLITRGIEQEFIPMSRHFDLGVLAYNPLAGGLLTGKHRLEERPSDGRFALFSAYPSRYWNAETFGILDRLSQLAGEYQLEMAELSLRWCAHRPGIDSVILGASSLGQLEQNLSWIQRGVLPDELLVRCDELWDDLTGRRFKYNR